MEHEHYFRATLGQEMQMETRRTDLPMEQGGRGIGELTEEDEAPEGAGEGGVGDAADGEVEAGVPLGVQVVPRRDPGPGGRGRPRRRRQGGSGRWRGGG